jgi:hypothetical protein
MTNEDILEEIYFVVRQNDVLDSFSEQVNRLLKFGEKKHLYEVVNEVYYKFIKEGLIKE